MSKVVFYTPLDGIGERPIDLHQCLRRFILARLSSDPDDWCDHLSIYYQFQDGLWVHHRGDADNYDGQWLEWYSQEHPVRAAHDLVYAKQKLPPELEPYRKYGDHQEFAEWLYSQGQGDGPSSDRTKPKWDRAGRTLYCGPSREYRMKRKAPNQWAVLDALEAAGWPESIANPLRSDYQLEQTIKDFHNRIGCPLRLRRDHARVRWEV